jgi:hypothetical protein
MNYLTVFIALIVLSFAQNSANKPDGSNAQGQNKTNDAGSAIREANPVTVNCNQGTGTITERDGKETPKWYATIQWSNWALVVVAGITGWVIWQQTIATRRAAEAGIANIRAFIGSERPLFIVRISPVEEKPGLYRVHATNEGKTPGELYDGHCCIKQHEYDFRLPEILDCPFAKPEHSLTVSGHGFNIRDIKPQSIVTEGMDEGINPKMVFVYGRLRYWDTMSDRSKTPPYVTEWCIPYFHWYGGQFIVGAGDNRNT